MTRRVDTLIIGGGIAGLFAALRASAHGSVRLVTKAASTESNTRYAQGGIAAALFPDDSVASHVHDTLLAGAGLCSEEAVRVLCAEGPQCVRDLIAIGIAFDRDGADLARGREAAHAAARVVHAGGDATGAEVQRGLESAVRSAGIDIVENTYVTDLIVRNGSVGGATFLTPDGKYMDVYAGVTVLATGGAGQVYKFTTNPNVATGDGAAAAFRAGAIISDAEMYQFHPTLLATSQSFLISEAVRGEGAILRNAAGERFADELAPRDIVARAIAQQMAAQDGEAVFLDATALGSHFLARRFPTIDAHCKLAGFDWSTTPVPVTPAAHFWMGGVATDLWGQTSLQNLYAIGEVASTGVHGANRLASNSLLEGLVFADRAIRRISSGSSSPHYAQATAVAFPRVDSRVAGSAPEREDIRQLTWDELGLARNNHGLRLAAKQLGVWANDLDTPKTTAAWEVHNLPTVAQLIATSAAMRKESRGAHYRTDCLQTDTVATHINIRLS